MSGEDAKLLSRLDAVAEAVSSMSALLASRESVDEALQQVARNAVKAVADADAVSITVLGDEQPRTVACTEEFLLALDAVQYRFGGGPCVEAASSRQPVRVAMDSTDQRWPRFAAAAQEAGVRATLSIPLILATGDADGGSELAGFLSMPTVTASANSKSSTKSCCRCTPGSHVRPLPLRGDGRVWPTRSPN